MSIRKVENPPNPYHSSQVEWLDSAPDAALQVFEERARSIISGNDSPDVGFRYSVNPYRGCFHGCAYCYARPTHQYLDFGAGSDFARKIVVKINSAELLETEFRKRSWRGDTIAFSGVTDCYQPLEASYEITRACLKVCADFRNPVVIITKGALVRRDIDLLSELHKNASIQVMISVAFSDDEISKRMEPSAPRPSIRFRAMKELSQAGIPVGIALAPVIPGLNDSQISEILEIGREYGAATAFMTLVRLPLEVKPVFLETLKREFPTFERRVVNEILELKQGTLNRSQFGKRMTGEGPRWEAIKWLFNQGCERLGLNQEVSVARGNTFSRPGSQLALTLG